MIIKKKGSIIHEFQGFGGVFNIICINEKTYICQYFVSMKILTTILILLLIYFEERHSISHPHWKVKCWRAVKYFSFFILIIYITLSISSLLILNTRRCVFWNVKITVPSEMLFSQETDLEESLFIFLMSSSPNSISASLGLRLIPTKSSLNVK